MFRSIAGTVLLLAATGFPAADPPPPALPSPAQGCVGASPVRYGPVPWAVARMAPYDAWPLTTGAGVTVAVLDSGVSDRPKALTGAVAEGVDVVAGGGARADCLGRGTALAAMVAGRAEPDTGVVGMAPAASVLPIRIIDERRGVPPGAIAAGILAAVDRGADVVLLGTGTVEDSAALRAAVAAAASHDVLIVAPVSDQPGSAGRPPTPWFPAAYPEVLAVGGIDDRGAATELTGPASGLDLFAPAVGAVVPDPTGDGHYAVSGPAVASAYVAGAAALVRAYRPSLTVAQVRERLELTSERAALAATGTVDPYAAVATLEPGQATRSDAATPSPVTVAAPPPADPALRRSGLVAGALVTLALVAGILLWVSQRRRGRARPPVGPAASG